MIHFPDMVPPALPRCDAGFWKSSILGFLVIVLTGCALSGLHSQPLIRSVKQVHRTSYNSHRTVDIWARGPARCHVCPIVRWPSGAARVEPTRSRYHCQRATKAQHQKHYFENTSSLCRQLRTNCKASPSPCGLPPCTHLTPPVADEN